MKTFPTKNATKLKMYYITFSLFGYVVWKDFNDDKFVEHRFLGFKIK